MVTHIPRIGHCRGTVQSNKIRVTESDSVFFSFLQTFNNWQMPSRFASTDDKIEHFDPPLHLKSDQPGMIKQLEGKTKHYKT